MSIFDVFAKKPPTVEQVDTETQKIREEIDRLNNRRATLEKQIGDSWGADTSEIEQEYNAIPGKIAVANQVIKRLQGVRAEAEQREQLTRYDDELKNLQSLVKRRGKALDNLEEIKKQVRVAEDSLKALNEQVGESEHILTAIETQLAKSGLPEAEQLALQTKREVAHNAN